MIPNSASVHLVARKPRILMILAVPVVLFVLAFPVCADDLNHLNETALNALHKGDFDAGITLLEKGVSLYPYEPALKKNLATAYELAGQQRLEKKRYAEAAALFDKARVLFPDDPHYHLLRGISFYKLSDLDLARNEFEQARSLGGDTAEVLTGLGRVLYDSGDTAAGVELWEKALALEPESTELKALLSKSRRELVVELRMDREQNARFIISYESGEGRSDIADKIIDTLEEFYNKVGSDLAAYPTVRVPVILYTKKDYRSVTASPDWSGGLYDGKIRLPVGGVTAIATPLRSLLRHEYTHVVVHDLTRGNCPTWLNEGLAVLEEGKEQPVIIEELAGATREGKLLPFSQLEGNFRLLDRKTVRIAYLQSYSFVSFLTSRYGWHKVQETLRALGEGKSITAAFAAAFRDYGLDYQAVQNEWLDSVRKEFGSGPLP